jgi:hypothetical protein
MAAEVMRVGRTYWVQTPDPRFPLEPHYLTPAIHWLPAEWQAVMARFTVWRILRHPTPAQIEERVAELRLLNRRELLGLFPGARLIVEKWAGLPKSLIVTNSLTERGF